MSDLFIFPFTFSELREQSSDNRYTVQGANIVKNQEEKLIKRQLNELDRLIYEDIHAIQDSDRFDYLFWIITMMDESKEKMSIEILVKVGDILCTHFSRMIKALGDIEAEESVNQSRDSFKMFAFLCFFFLNASCVKKAKKVLISNEMRGGKKELPAEFIEKIAEKQATMLHLFEDSLLINFKALWHRMLESKQLLRQQKVKETLFNILKKVIFLNSESLSTIQFKLINLIYEEENIVENICDFLLSTQKTNFSNHHSEQNGKYSSQNYNDNKQNQMIAENNSLQLFLSDEQKEIGERNFSLLCTETLTRLVNYANQTNAHQESQAVKNVKEFLFKMSEKIPKIFYNHLSSFVQLLDNEAYHLRNAVVDIMANIIRYVLSPRSHRQNNHANEEEDMENEFNEDDDRNETFESRENYEQSKEKILDALIQRVYDKHAFSRSHVLSVFIDLCVSNLIPQNYLLPLLGCACDRIKDTSANVRKKAIVLLHRVMEFYFIVFAGSQNRNKFHTQEELTRELSFVAAEMLELSNEAAQIEVKLQDRAMGLDVEEWENLKQKLNQVKEKINQCGKLKTNLDEYLKMILQIDSVMPNLLQLLGSKNNSDATETIKLLIYLHKTNIVSAAAGIRKMLVLIWSKEKQVKEELVKAYWVLYMDEKLFKAEGVAKNLVYLFKKANLTDLTSLEELLLVILRWNDSLDEKERDKKQDLFYLSTRTFDKVWEIFMQAVTACTNAMAAGINQNGNNDSNSKFAMRAALTILRICSCQDRAIFSDNRMISLIEVLKKFLRMNTPDWIVVKEIGMLVEVQKSQCVYLNSFVKLLMFILIKFQGTEDNEWYCACEQIMNTIFTIESNPESLIKYIILRCTKTLMDQTATSNSVGMGTATEGPNIQASRGSMDEFASQSPMILKSTRKMEVEQNSSVDYQVTPFKSPERAQEMECEDNSQVVFERRLGHLLFLVGHCALKLLIHVDSIESELKKLRVESEKRQEEAQNKEGNEGAAAELDKIYGGLEAEYEKRLDFLHKIAEENIVNGDNLIAQYKPWVSLIVQDILQNSHANSLKYRNVDLDRVAVLTLCKFMCVSKSYCEMNLPVLFRLLECPHSDHLLKINIIVSLGDLLHKYPNLVEPYNSKVFAKLHDVDVQVRKTTMMVLTHLILNDMMKIRGEICEVALLLEDEEPKIQNIVKLFLHELHKKDQKIIYNLLPEAIGRMSRQDQTELGAPINEKTFEIFAKNIMQYLEKDKYSETLVEKLCVRFTNSTNEREWRNCSYCLSQLSYNEKGLRKLIEFYESYREKLNDIQIMDNFQAILNKLKRLPKPELKPLIEEFESKITTYKTEAFEAIKRKEPATGMKHSRSGKNPGNNKRKDESLKENSISMSNRSGMAKRSKRVVNKEDIESLQLDDDDDDDDFIGDNDEEEDYESNNFMEVIEDGEEDINSRHPLARKPPAISVIQRSTKPQIKAASSMSLSSSNGNNGSSKRDKSSRATRSSQKRMIVESDEEGSDNKNGSDEEDEFFR